MHLQRLLKLPFYYVHLAALHLHLIVLPAHYYSSAPNILELKKEKQIWAKRSELPGLEIDIEEQEKNLRDICLPYRDEYRLHDWRFESGEFGQGFGIIEPHAYYSMIRHLKPQKIIEVGSGMSTYCALAALSCNNAGTVTCIEPYPSNYLKYNKNIVLIKKRVQELDPSFFKCLKENDILFVDGSHVVKVGSDVNYIILEVLPRLNKGVIVHFHDIFFPYDYQRDTTKNFFHWSETSLLRGFLIGNSHAKILFSMSQLHYDKQKIMKECFFDYDPEPDINGLNDLKPFERSKKHFPSSIYIKIT